jgi:hypothetical protein
VYLYVDAKQTSKKFVDLDTFLRVLFHNELHEQIARAIIEYLIQHKKAYLMAEIIPYIQREKKIKIEHHKLGKEEEMIVSKDTVGKVWKAMWKSGLLNKKYRYEPVQLSKIFSFRLRELADYWENYVTQYS